MAGCTQPGRQPAADSRRAMAQVVRRTRTTDASSARWCEAAGRLAASCAICKLPRTSSPPLDGDQLPPPAQAGHTTDVRRWRDSHPTRTARSTTRPRWTKPRTGGPSAPRRDHHRGGAPVSNAQPAAAARQQAAQTPGPQIRGGTIDAVDAADDAMAEKLGGIERRGEHVAMRTAARSLRPHRPTAPATRQSGPDGSPLAAQLRDRHRTPRLATAESVARGRAAPAGRRLSCTAGQHAVVASVSTSIRSLCTGCTG